MENVVYFSVGRQFSRSRLPVTSEARLYSHPELMRASETAMNDIEMHLSANAKKNSKHNSGLDHPGSHLAGLHATSRACRARRRSPSVIPKPHRQIPRHVTRRVVFVSTMRGRGRSGASASRWKGVDVLQHIEQSKHAGEKRIMHGGVARLSVGSNESIENEDDTLYVWADADLLPNGAVMISARKATFDERWPYTGRRGWRPTSNKVRERLIQLAEAGFHYTPGSGEDDGCTCIYCGVELGGWERSDDPVYVLF